jgi:N-acyl-D-aspartate/D-glutamate deacylase
MIADVLIKNARICDGTGDPIYTGSVAIKDGRIMAVGDFDIPAREVHDAGGKVVAPGFIDPHTHFDAQLLWDGHAKPSLEHGVTTVVQGNCSLSLAPLRKEHREFLSATFRQIEEMPQEPFEAGVQWRWESFEDYLASIREQLAINLAPMVGHSMIRLWVMGMDARTRAATTEEIAQMADLLRECLRVGGAGLSTSWTDIDHTFNGVPCRHATEEEFRGLCAALGEFDRVLQVVPEFWDADLLCARIDILAEWSLEFKITCSFSPLFHSNSTPDLVARAVERIELQAGRGARVVPQMQVRPIDYTFDLRAPGMMFSALPGWWPVLMLPNADKKATFADPEKRAALLAEVALGRMPLALSFKYEDIIVNRVGLPKHEALIGTTLGELARQRGTTPVEAMMDLASEDDFGTSFTMEGGGHNNSEVIGKFLAHPLVEIGAADGGAHVHRFATYGDTGLLFSHFVRERNDLSLELAVHKVTQDVARAWRLKNRGVLKPGYFADVVVFDPATIARGPEIAVEDLPAPGYRYIREALGVEKVFVNGNLTYSAADGYTDSHTGKIVFA